MTAPPYDREWDDEGNAAPEDGYPSVYQEAFLASIDLLLDRLTGELAVLRDLRGIAGVAGYVGEV